MNMKIYYDNKNDSIFNDYINIIKIITSYISYFLNIFLFDYDFKSDNSKELSFLHDTLDNFIELVKLLLSQPIIRDSEHNEYIIRASYSLC